MEKSGFDMYVFRDGRKQCGGRELLDRLARALARLSSAQGGQDAQLTALIAAGELECALRDRAIEEPHWTASAEAAERITSHIAEIFAGTRASLPEAESLVSRIEVPPVLSIAVQEGFAYYALHPKKFQNLMRTLTFPPGIGVIGIRSIGAPLSAVVAAVLPGAERITVRPTGHPYERNLEITGEFRKFVERHRQSGFIIVDEGPGLSGSSFLSVAEAIAGLGVEEHRITLLGSRAVDHPSQLRTPNAAARWAKFRVLSTAQEPILPVGAVQAIGGGWWRRVFLPDLENQPATWTQLERSKYLSKDHRTFFKFEGYGHYGEEIASRAGTLEREGFGPRYLGSEAGFGRYEVVAGRMLRATDATTELLRTMARYCAMRSREMMTKPEEESRLPQMLAWNWKCEFGEDLPPQLLEVERLITTDSRMLPHEWIASERGLLKLDGCSHGDDHFFPGPCDIAWDVAGAIVEWNLDRHASQYFVDAYTRESGDPVGRRLSAYLLAYTTFRMGWSKMAAHASAGEFDQQLLERDYQRYRLACERLIKNTAAA